MKKATLISVLIIAISGCQNHYSQGLSELNEQTQELDYLMDEIICENTILKKQEQSFIRSLNDQQLIAYENAVQVFKDNEPSARELACRNLQSVCDSNEYNIAINLLVEKDKIKRKDAKLRDEYYLLMQQYDYLEEDMYRRQQAQRDYMLMNTIMQK